MQCAIQIIDDSQLSADMAIVTGDFGTVLFVTRSARVPDVARAISQMIPIPQVAAS